MKSFNGIDISFAFNWIYLIGGFIFIIVYTFVNYRITVPPISKQFRFILSAIRIFVLLIILTLIFEPKIILSFVNPITPLNLVFIDNSNSIAARDSSGRISIVKKTVSEFDNNINGKNNIYLFSASVKKVAEDSLQKINFNGQLTNPDNIFSFISKKDISPTTVTLISDGIINDGNNPYYSVQKLGVPVFTLGIGDTSKLYDVTIKNIYNNRFVYANEPTTIRVAIFNKGLSGKSANISFFENNKFLKREKVITAKDGINNIDFFYTPKKSGKIKLSFKISRVGNERNIVNNSKSVIINVLKNKLNILLVGGSPSADFEFVKQSLAADPKLKINNIVQISNNIILNLNNIDSYINNSNIIFLIGFPTTITPKKLFDKIISAIKNQNKSFFFLLSANTALNRLRVIKDKLPFLFFNQTNRVITAQLHVESDVTGLLKSNGNFNPLLWNLLPPISITSTDFKAKPGTFILSNVKISNQILPYPLIIADNLGNSNSIAILGFDIWKWKLQTNDAEKNLFDSFIHNSVKWLNNASQKKLFYLQSEKDIFERGEPINISAQLYDQTFSPINNARISAVTTVKNEKIIVNFLSHGNGIYTGKMNRLPVGNYKLTAAAAINGNIVNKAQIKIRVENSNIEKYNIVMNKALLQSLAKTSGGKYFDISNYEKAIKVINKFNSDNKKEVHTVKSYNLLSFEWLLALTIFLFGLEWFLRKRSGLM